MQTFVNTVNFPGKDLKTDWQVKPFLVAVPRAYVILVQRTSPVTRQLEEDNAASAASDLYSAANDVAVRLKPDKSFFFGFSKESRVPRLPCAEHKLFLSTQFGPRGFFLNKGREKPCLLSRLSLSIAQIGFLLAFVEGFLLV